MNQQTLSLSAWISLLSLATIWGGSFLAYSLILREVPVFTLVANRVLLGKLNTLDCCFINETATTKFKAVLCFICHGFLE
jgi:hypothetical protein